MDAVVSLRTESFVIICLLAWGGPWVQAQEAFQAPSLRLPDPPPFSPASTTGNEFAGTPWNGSAAASGGGSGFQFPDVLSWFNHNHEPQPVLPEYYDPFGWQFAYGSAGVQPYYLGWYSRDEVVLMPSSRASAGGNFQAVEWNSWFRYSQMISGSTIFSWTPAINGKFWSGPTGIGFPPDGTQFVSDFQLASANPGSSNWQIGVTPQLNSDFSRSLTSNALMCDVRAVWLFRPSPEWTLAMGAAYWNRASDHFIPYAGVIWAPDDRWEFRLLFPKSRISYFLGRFGGSDTWIYGAGEYYVDAYQLDLESPRVSHRGELSDYRLLLGTNVQRGSWNCFAECGIVLDRHVRFRGDTPDFTIANGLFLRVGLTY